MAKETASNLSKNSTTVACYGMAPAPPTMLASCLRDFGLRRLRLQWWDVLNVFFAPESHIFSTITVYIRSSVFSGWSCVICSCVYPGTSMEWWLMPLLHASSSLNVRRRASSCLSQRLLSIFFNRRVTCLVKVSILQVSVRLFVDFIFAFHVLHIPILYFVTQVFLKVDVCCIICLFLFCFLDMVSKVSTSVQTGLLSNFFSRAAKGALYLVWSVTYFVVRKKKIKISSNIFRLVTKMDREDPEDEVWISPVRIPRASWPIKRLVRLKNSLRNHASLLFSLSFILNTNFQDDWFLDVSVVFSFNSLPTTVALQLRTTSDCWCSVKSLWEICKYHNVMQQY